MHLLVLPIARQLRAPLLALACLAGSTGRACVFASAFAALAIGGCAPAGARAPSAAAALAAAGGDGASTPTTPSPAGIIKPAPPPKDDGEPAKGGQGGLEHAAALEELKAAGLDWREDRQNSVHILLPDAATWLRVKFWGVQSLVGFRYGKDHHAIVGGFILHVHDEMAPGACVAAFEAWAQPYVEAFEVEVKHDPPRAITWTGKIVDIDSLIATTATLGNHDQYVAAYATYPAWPGACLIAGIAIPARDELERAKAVRDRFAADVLPKLRLTSPKEPKEMY